MVYTFQHKTDTERYVSLQVRARHMFTGFFC